MDIKLLFDRVPAEVVDQKYDRNCLFHSLHINAEKVPDLNNIDMAIIGVVDGRAMATENGVKDAPDHIRKQLYELKKGKPSYRIADLGNLRNGHDLDETKARLSELLSSLYEKGILPIVIGGTHDFDIAQYQAYELTEKLVSVLNVDARIDMSDDSEAVPTDKHIHEILMHEPNFLFDYIHLGYQSYLVPYNSLEVLEKLNFNLVRLGKLRDAPKEVEPVVREADMVTFDISAIQSTVMKATHQPIPFGLTGEEAAQIAWFAGCSDKLSSMGFYGYDPGLDDQHMSSAFVIAVALWYFMEGYYNRKDQHDFSTKYYTKYIATLADQEPNEIVFYKSTQSEKWWMEVPVHTAKRLYARNKIVSCSYEDYTSATKGEIPDRWIVASSKVS